MGPIGSVPVPFVLVYIMGVVILVIFPGITLWLPTVIRRALRSP